MFDQFPKQREELPEEYKAIYNSHYKANRAGDTPASSMAQRLEKWMHRMIAGDLVKGAIQEPTLEIGAGTLNHLPYEPDIKDYDIIEPFQELFQQSSKLSEIRDIYNDISEVPRANRYNRIISVATFEHIPDLPKVVAHSGLLLGKGGRLRVSIPNEGTILWTLGWLLTTGIEFRIRYGLNYSPMMEFEHINDADEIEHILNYFYQSMTTKVLGLNKRFAFYRFMECSRPDISRCEDYLNSLA